MIESVVIKWVHSSDGRKLVERRKREDKTRTTSTGRRDRKSLTPTFNNPPSFSLSVD
jgi:hypothetical protein